MSCCGSSGYSGPAANQPGSLDNQGGALGQTMMGNLGTGTYSTNPQANTFNANVNPSQQAGFYNPMSSGYNFMQGNAQGTGTSYNPSMVNLTDMAKQYYQPVLSNTQQATMQGGQTGANNMMSQLGNRGIQGGGVAQMALGGNQNAMANQMAQNSANIGMQQANVLTGLNTQQQLANQGAQNTASQQGIQNYLGAMQAQSNADYNSRMQQMQNYNTPIQQMMQMYGINAQAPGNQAQAGGFGSMMGGLGSMMGGLGSLTGEAN